jgi:glycosyltransferase involved in cell wall biosynthesis
MITNNWIYGGRERVIKCLCEGFRDLLGWDVTLVVARRRDNGGSRRLERFPEPRGTPVRWLETDRLRGVVLPLGRLIRELRPDVVFWHVDAGTFPYYWLASVLAGGTSRVVPVYHGLAPISGQSVRFRFGERLGGVVARRVSESVAVSKGTASEVERRFRLKPQTVRVVSNSVDLLDVRSKAAGPEPEELAGKHPVVLVVARLSPDKDWETLLVAFTAVAEETNASLYIVGEGEEHERIIKLARDVGVADRVVLTGEQPNPYKYMSHADVSVLCSHHEGFPMVLLESMVCGVPVVATDCESGPGEIVVHGHNGLLVPPEDPAALAEGILAILTDAELAQRLRQGGMERAEEFTLRKAVEAYRQIVEHVCWRRRDKVLQSVDEKHVSKRGSCAKKQ